jgi:hypothetical protein
MGVLSKLSDVADGAPFGAPSDRLQALGGKRVRARDSVDGDGDAYQMPDGSIQGFALRTPSAAWIAAQVPRNTAEAARAAKTANNVARIETLGLRAARYAKDPVANAADQLTARLQHELLARLALATRTDDV